MAFLPLVLLAAGLALVGCSSDGDDDDGSSSEPVARCERYVDESCNYVSRCQVLSKADCLTQVKAEIDCTRAKATTDGYSQCIADIQAATCPVSGQSFTIPASCNKVILVQSFTPSGEPWSSVSSALTGESAR